MLIESLIFYLAAMRINRNRNSKFPLRFFVMIPPGIRGASRNPPLCHELHSAERLGVRRWPDAATLLCTVIRL